MPRPRKNDPTPIIRPLLADFARALAVHIERQTMDRVRDVLDGARRLRGGGRALRSQITCYYPGCKNVAAPRFGMFCAAEHKGLSASEKEKYRKQRLAKSKD